MTHGTKRGYLSGPWWKKKIKLIAEILGVNSIYIIVIGIVLGYFFGAIISLILISCWIVPCCRFNHPFSFGIFLFDFTLGTTDGGLHMDLGWIIKLPIYLYMAIFTKALEELEIERNKELNGCSARRNGEW